MLVTAGAATEEAEPVSTQPTEDTVPTPEQTTRTPVSSDPPKTVPPPHPRGRPPEAGREPVSTQPTEDTAPPPTPEAATGQTEPVSTQLTRRPPSRSPPVVIGADGSGAGATPASIPKPSAVPTPAALAKSAPVRRRRPPSADPDRPLRLCRLRPGRRERHRVRRTKEGEKEVGSYPGASADEALTYFARKYDELYASAVLLAQRLAQPEVPSKDVADALKALTAQVNEASVVGDLEALATQLDTIQSGIAAKRTVEQQHRAEARAAAAAERERIVAEAEGIAAQPENRIQWKQSGARMRELLDEWGRVASARRDTPRP